MLRLQGGNSSGAGVIILSFLHRRCMLLCLGPHRRQMQLIQCGNMRGFGSSAFQCHIHHHIRGINDPGRQYTTDWGHTNLVQLSRHHRSNRSRQRPAQFAPPRMEYRVKEKKSEVQPDATPEKAKANTIVQIGKIKVVVQDKGKEPMVIDKSATSSATPVQRPFTTNNHEASGSKVADKYHQPRWCPEGLTHTQKRKLQRLRNKEKRE